MNTKQFQEAIREVKQECNTIRGDTFPFDTLSSAKQGRYSKGLYESRTKISGRWQQLMFLESVRK
jgi:hypothetical protein